MTDVNDLFPSNYLKASDATPSITVTISQITKEVMTNKDTKEKEEKNVIYFQGISKGMVLNKTNATTLGELLGKTVEKWVGGRVVLGTEMVTAYGKTAPALRFKHEEVKYDHTTLLKHYQSIYEEAVKLKLPNLETFVLDAGASDATIIELGKELRGLVDAAKAF